MHISFCGCYCNGEDAIGCHCPKPPWEAKPRHDAQLDFALNVDNLMSTAAAAGTGEPGSSFSPSPARRPSSDMDLCDSTDEEDSDNNNDHGASGADDDAAPAASSLADLLEESRGDDVEPNAGSSASNNSNVKRASSGSKDASAEALSQAQLDAIARKTARALLMSDALLLHKGAVGSLPVGGVVGPTKMHVLLLASPKASGDAHDAMPFADSGDDSGIPSPPSSSSAAVVLPPGFQARPLFSLRSPVMGPSSGRQRHRYTAVTMRVTSSAAAASASPAELTAKMDGNSSASNGISRAWTWVQWSTPPVGFRGPLPPLPALKRVASTSTALRVDADDGEDQSYSAAALAAGGGSC